MASSPVDSSKKVIIGAGITIVSIVLVFVLFFWVVPWLINIVPPAWKELGTPVSTSYVNLDSAVGKFLHVTLGIDEIHATYESVILFIAIFLILFFAFAEIIEMFSTFTTTTSYIIALGLALIMGVSRMISFMAAWFGLTAGIGAIGIGIIILSAVIVAVIINLGVGQYLKDWLEERRLMINASKSKSTFIKAIEAVKNLATTTEETAKK